MKHIHVYLRRRQVGSFNTDTGVGSYEPYSGMVWNEPGTKKIRVTIPGKDAAPLPTMSEVKVAIRALDFPKMQAFKNRLSREIRGYEPGMMASSGASGSLSDS